MPEDKLTRDERIRLESFAQALAYKHIQASYSRVVPALLDIFDIAEKIETWLKKANQH